MLSGEHAAKVDSLTVSNAALSAKLEKLKDDVAVLKRVNAQNLLIFQCADLYDTLIKSIVSNPPTDLQLPDSWKTVQQFKKSVEYAVAALPADQKFYLPNTIQQTTPTPLSVDSGKILDDLWTILAHLINKKVAIDLPVFVTLFRLNLFGKVHLGHSDDGPPATAASIARFSAELANANVDFFGFAFGNSGANGSTRNQSP
jgi:hypothetical protein